MTASFLGLSHLLHYNSAFKVINLLFQVPNVPLSTSGSMTTRVSEESETALEMTTGATAMEECKLGQYYFMFMSSQISKIKMNHTSLKKSSFPIIHSTMSIFLRSH